jgi:hypothetical protein
MRRKIEDRKNRPRCEACGTISSGLIHEHWELQDERRKESSGSYVWGDNDGILSK